MIINLSANPPMNILAEPPTSFPTGSVQFSVDGKVLRIENLVPYISGTATAPWKPTVGQHIIKVTPYQEKKLGGTAGVPTIVTVFVVDEKQVPTKSPTLSLPTPLRGPVVAPISSMLILTLIDANRNTPISRMTNGMKVDLTKYPLLNIVVDVASSLSVDRLEFFYDGDRVRVEYNAPYSFYGNDDNVYFGWRPTLGEHYVEVRAYKDNSLVAYDSISFFTY
jgi:hypothetical protein